MSCTWRKMKDWYELSLLIYWVVISLVISIWYSYLFFAGFDQEGEKGHVWTMWFHFSYCAGEPYLFEPYSYEPYFIHSWTKWWYNLEVGLVLLSWSILTMELHSICYSLSLSLSFSLSLWEIYISEKQIVCTESKYPNYWEMKHGHPSQPIPTCGMTSWNSLP